MRECARVFMCVCVCVCVFMFTCVYVGGWVGVGVGAGRDVQGGQGGVRVGDFGCFTPCTDATADS